MNTAMRRNVYLLDDRGSRPVSASGATEECGRSCGGCLSSDRFRPRTTRFADCCGLDLATNADCSLPRLGLRTVCGHGLFADMERVRRCHAQGLFKPADGPGRWPPTKHIARSFAGRAATDSRTQKPCGYKGKRVPCLKHDEEHNASSAPSIHCAILPVAR